MEESSKICESNLLKASFDEFTNSVLSKVFLIRYCEEEIPLNCLIQYRAEISAYPKPNPHEIYFECELHFHNVIEKLKTNYVSFIIKIKTIGFLKKFCFFSKESGASKGSEFFYFMLDFQEQNP